MKMNRNKLLYCVLINCVIILLCGELFLRFFIPQQTYSRFLQLAGNYYAASESNTFTLQKNFKGVMVSQEFPGRLVKTTTNSLGLRGKEITIEKPSGYKRILVLGDSYTFGIYVSDDETYPAVLEKLLTGQGYKCEVINAGYADGFEADDIYCWLVNEGKKFKPDIIIYGFFGGNDIMGIRPDDWASLDHRGLPNKIIHSNLYVDDLGYLRSKRKDYKTVATEDIYRIPILRDSHLIILLYNQYLKLEGVSKDFGQSFYSHIFKESDEQFDVMEKYFLKLVEGMNEFAMQENAKFIIMMIPYNFQVEPDLISKVFPHKIYKGIKLEIKRDYYAELEQKLKKMGINSINILTKMKQSPNQKYFPRNGEVHFNPNGNLFTAMCIDDFLLKNHTLDNSNIEAVPLGHRH